MTMRTQFGIPDSLPPLNLRDVWGRLWLGLTGLLLLVLSLVPNLVPPPWGSALVLVCWLVLPVRGLMNQSTRKSRTDAQISEIVKNGKGRYMPSFKAKLSDDEINAVVAHVRSLAKKR